VCVCVCVCNALLVCHNQAFITLVAKSQTQEIVILNVLQTSLHIIHKFQKLRHYQWILSVVMTTWEVVTYFGSHTLELQRDLHVLRHQKLGERMQTHTSYSSIDRE
jgi:hypothetical protein